MFFLTSLAEVINEMNELALKKLVYDFDWSYKLLIAKV